MKVWNVEDMAYVETLYGHQSGITGIAALYQERAVTVAQDRTLRVWKVADETQLLFRGHAAAIDAVTMLNEERYMTGSEDGSLALWTDKRKKPVCVLPRAHGDNWITAVAAQAYTDFAVSGSSDGMLRLWNCGGGDGGGASRLKQIGAVPLPGFINGLAVSTSGRFAVAAMGNEHRMGRWTPVTRTRNGMAVIDLRAPQKRRRSNDGDDDDDDEHVAVRNGDDNDDGSNDESE
jgi:ribosomal RNA-processing protein 9